MAAAYPSHGTRESIRLSRLIEVPNLEWPIEKPYNGTVCPEKGLREEAAVQEARV